MIYNCHPTISAEDADYLSSDYPGSALDILKQRYPKEFFLFLQGPCGDVSTRFTRQAKNYDEVIRLANEIVSAWEKMMKLTPRMQPLKLDWNDQTLPIHKGLKTFDINQMDTASLSEKEIRELHTGAKMVEQYRGMLAMLPNEVRFTRVSLGPFRLIFNPFELFSGYMQNLDPKDGARLLFARLSGLSELPGQSGNLVRNDDRNLFQRRYTSSRRTHSQLLEKTKNQPHPDQLKGSGFFFTPASNHPSAAINKLFFDNYLF